jgi:hypothetical protein
MSDELFNFLVVLALIGVFLLLSGLALWGLGLLPLWVLLLKGFAGLLGLNVAWVLVSMVVNSFVRLEPSAWWVFGLNMVLTLGLVLSWNVYLVQSLQAQSFTSLGAWIGAFAVGLLPCYLGIVLIGSFFFGTLFQIAGLVVGVSSYLILVLVSLFSR